MIDIDIDPLDIECMREERGARCWLFKNTFTWPRGSLTLTNSISEKGKKSRSGGRRPPAPVGV